MKWVDKQTSDEARRRNLFSVKWPLPGVWRNHNHLKLDYNWVSSRGTWVVAGEIDRVWWVPSWLGVMANGHVRHLCSTTCSACCVIWWDAHRKIFHGYHGDGEIWYYECANDRCNDLSLSSPHVRDLRVTFDKDRSIWLEISSGVNFRLVPSIAYLRLLGYRSAITQRNLIYEILPDFMGDRIWLLNRKCGTCSRFAEGTDPRVPVRTRVQVSARKTSVLLTPADMQLPRALVLHPLHSSIQATLIAPEEEEGEEPLGGTQLPRTSRFNDSPHCLNPPCHVLIVSSFLLCSRSEASACFERHPVSWH